MAKVIVFNLTSLDGYFIDAHGTMDWARAEDPEWQEFSAGNARGGGTLLFGRVTYDLMAGYWPTAAAAQANSVVAERMNALPKVVFSRSMDKARWANTRVVHTDPAEEVRRLKTESETGMAIMGSGTIVSLLTEKGLIDEYQIVVCPIVLGSGRTMFAGVAGRPRFKLIDTRSFANGNVFLRYTPADRQ